MSNPNEDVKNRPVAERDKVPLKEKLTYSCGQVGVGLQEYADNQILNPIFIVGMGISPALMGILGVFYRAWDAITDATMGTITDNTRTRWGRRRPFIFVGSFLMAIAMPLMFLFNPEWDLLYITLWMIVFQLVLTVTQTFYNIPYQSLMLEMTPDTNERTNISACRSYFGIITSFFAGWTLFLCMQPIFQPEGKEAAPIYGAPWVIGGFAILSCILGLLPAFFAKERFYQKTRYQEKVSILQSLKITLCNRPFLLLLGFVLTGIVGSGVVESLGFYLRLYYVCETDMLLFGKVQGLESFLRIGSSIAGIRFFQWLAVKTSKRTTVLIIAALALAGAVSKFFCYTPDMPFLSIVPVVVFLAPTMSAVWMVVLSMVGDVVDDEELRSEERLEGAFTAVFSWTQKVTYSMRSALSGFVVVWAGFDVAKRDQLLPENVVNNMFLLLILVPVVLIGISMVMLKRYPLTNARIQQTRRKLEERRGEI